ncbi:cell wall hydrolase [Roseburia inulinivorans]
MNLKKRAAGAIAVAMSVVVMTSVAQAAPADYKTGVASQATTTDLATNGIAGIAVSMSQYESDAYEYIELADANVEQMNVARVTSGDAAEQDAEGGLTEMSADVADADTAVQAENAASDTETDVSTETAGSEQTEEEALWQNRLMADVNDYLYVRASADADAEIVGKLYKGDVAEIQEEGSGWTHVASGNVDGYVNNDYCVTGTEALAYAQQNFDTEAEVLTNGLRIRSEADENASVITAVSEGTTLKVDSDVETDDQWIAVVYGGTTRYVSADYVTTSLALGEGITIEEEQAELARIAEEEAAKKAAQVTEVTTVQNAAVEATVDDVTLLAAIIQCEAGNEVYEGQLAVGAVVMNRVRSGGYPSTVHDVIYQKSQFPPAGAGSVANVAAKGPKQSCLQAAQEALNGTDNTGGATCFRRASSGHAGVVIGNHVFY